MRKLLVVAVTVLILVVINWAIFDKERHLAHGEVVYLELAPVDPRSLMQGDYMALSFAIGNQIQAALHGQDSGSGASSRPGDGYVVVRRGVDGVAHFQRLEDGETTLADDEMRLRYRMRNGRVQFATNAFFFQEGHAERYEAARFGQFRVNERGDPLLVAMHDEALDILGGMPR